MARRAHAVSKVAPFLLLLLYVFVNFKPGSNFVFLVFMEVILLFWCNCFLKNY